MDRIRLFSRSGRRSHAGALLAAALLLVLAAAPMPMQAQTVNLPAVQHFTLGESNQLPAGLQVGAAIVNEVGGITPCIIVWVFDQRSGFRQGDTLTLQIPAGVTPAAIHFSTIFRPNSLLVLDTAHKVHEFMLMFDAGGTPRLAGTAIHDFAALLGGPTHLGVGTSLGEVSGVDPSPFQPWLAIGTSSGNLILANPASIDPRGGIAPCILPVGDGPIVDLAVVPQVGTWVFVALVNSARGGQRLVGVAPPDGTHPDGQIVFDLVSVAPPDDQIVDLAGGTPDDNMPLSEPMAVNLVAANGTRFVHRLTLPPDPILESSFGISSLQGPHVAIGHVALGSLAMSDGFGIFYDPGFNVDTGGVSGTLLTVFGNTMDLSPKTLNLRSRGNFITGAIEVHNGGAAGIDPSSVMLHVNGGSVRALHTPAPQLGDADGDGNADLMVKFDRMMVQNMIPAGAAQVMVTVHFQFTDGSAGFASALLKVVR